MDSERFGLADSFNYFSGETLETHQIDMERCPAPVFTLPPVQNPARFVQEMAHSDGPEKKLMEFAKGTTTLAFKFREGVLVAVDSRASMGEFESSNTVFKVIEMNDFMIGTMAGGAADCQYWEAYLTKEARVYELKHGQRMTISAASKLMQNIIYQYRGYGLSIGCMIAGVDKNGTHLYYVDNEANRIIGNAFSVGSGSPYAYGVMDTYNQDDLTLEQAIEIGKRAIYNATYHDSGSGGVCRGKTPKEKSTSKAKWME